MRQAIAIAERIGPKAISQKAKAKEFLGVLLLELNRRDDAEKLLEQGSATARKLEGEHSNNYAWSLIRLAHFYYSGGRLQEAERFLRQAIEVFRELQGKGCPDHPVALSGLGDVLYAQGKYDEAERVLRQSLQAFDERKEGNDRNRHITLESLIRVCIKRGRWEEALTHCTESQQAERRWLAQVLPALAPGEQLVYLSQVGKEPLFTALSVAMRCSDKSKAAATSAEWLLNSKAIGAECLAEQMQLVRQSNDPDVKQTLHELTAVREQLAGAVLHQQQGLGSGGAVEQAALYQKERDLSRKLALQTHMGSHRSEWVSLAEVRKAVAAKSVLIEIARFQVADFDVPGKAARFGVPRYVAWVIPPVDNGEVQMVDLGDASLIDDAVAKGRIAIIPAPEAISVLGIRKSAQAVDFVTSRLADLVYTPLVEAIGDASTLLVSLDGGLWLFPWERLPTTDGRFLVEEKRIAYLPTGRAILNQVPCKSGSGAVLFTDPDYDMMPSAAQMDTVNDWVLLFGSCWDLRRHEPSGRCAVQTHAR